MPNHLDNLLEKLREFNTERNRFRNEVEDRELSHMISATSDAINEMYARYNSEDHPDPKFILNKIKEDVPSKKKSHMPEWF